MGLLAPLYALAALAVAGPIIFHLIRRQPQGQLQFSSLMFLTPSPPRLTRRSRLDNLLLLLLRALAIGLIAFAFARPYLRQESLLNTSLSGRNIVILIDTSASMQRDSVWLAALDKLDELIASMSSGDRAALYTIDDVLTPIVAFDSEQAGDGQSSQEAVRMAAKNLTPTWKRTELAEGLRTVADLLNSATISGKIQAGTDTEVVLISDLHTGCGLESLQGYPWPDSIRLDVRRVLPASPGNARPSLMASEAEDSEDSIRVRIENNAGSKDQAFELTWAAESGPITSGTSAAGSSRVQVPAGQVRVIPMAAQPTRADRISLIGDAWDGDNDVFVVQSEPELQRVAFLGLKQTKPEQDIGYFLGKAPLSTPLVRRELEVVEAASLPAITQDAQVKSIVLEPLSGVLEQAESLREFARGGGTVLVCLARENTDGAMAADLLERLLGVGGIKVSEARVKDFSLFGSIDYRHPVFSPFADPKYNDFSKIRFWSHRHVELPLDGTETLAASGPATPGAATPGAATPGAAAEARADTTLHVVARFDDNTPMLLEQTLGRGHIWVLTAGWHPAGSGLALSSKFVPIVMGILDPSGQTRRLQQTYEVGDRIPFSGELESVVDSQGRELGEDRFAMVGNQVRILEAGLFQLVGPDYSRTVAVQVPASESRLLPLDGDVFEQYGISLGAVKSDKQRREAARQMQVEELEGQQRLWQWLIAAGIIVLAVETLAAGWLTRRQLYPATST